MEMIQNSDIWWNGIPGRGHSQCGGPEEMEAAVKIKAANGRDTDLEPRRWQEPGFASPVPCWVPSSAL